MPYCEVFLIYKLHVVDPQRHAGCAFVCHSAARRRHDEHVGRRGVRTVPAYLLDGYHFTFGVFGVIASRSGYKSM